MGFRRRSTSGHRGHCGPFSLRLFIAGYDGIGHGFEISSLGWVSVDGRGIKLSLSPCPCPCPCPLSSFIIIFAISLLLPLYHHYQNAIQEPLPRYLCHHRRDGPASRHRKPIQDLQPGGHPLRQQRAIRRLQRRQEQSFRRSVVAERILRETQRADCYVLYPGWGPVPVRPVCYAAGVLC